MNRYRKIIVLSLKIGIGSSLALYIAESLGLNYAISAGTITLLSLMTSKWGTVKLSVCRLATFTITVLIAWQIFSHVESPWISYGILLTIIVFITELFDWRSTLSVNGVIAAHLVTNRDFSDAAIWNEFLLVLIGIIFAIFFNLFHGNFSHKKHIIQSMKLIEHRLQLILSALASYLLNEQMERNVWEDICTLENDIQNCIKEAYEYQNNTFHSHPEYYISYFEMRYRQCQVLHTMHHEIEKIRTMSTQANVVAEYMLYLVDFVTEFNYPDKQIEKLNDIFKMLEKDELPKTHEEFKNRALVYHIMTDIEDFLEHKMRFIKELDETKLKIYWKHTE